MGEVHILEHPLIQHKLTLIREKNTGSKDFRELVKEVSMLMAYEVTRNLPTKLIEIETPICPMQSRVLKGEKIGIIPILRAGLGMLDGILELLPTAKVGHIGIFRDPKTKMPVHYYCKLPSDISERDLIVADPLLATGGSLNTAISLIKKEGGKKISCMCLIAAPEGIEAVRKEHPEADIYVAAVDSILNDHAFIVPGLGDAGDRLFGTK